MVEVKERALTEADVIGLVAHVDRVVQEACLSFVAEPGALRKLARVEVNAKMRDAIYRWAFRDRYDVDAVPYLRGEKPLEVNGVTYYVIDRAIAPWKIIAPIVSVGGRHAARIVEAEKAD